MTKKTLVLLIIFTLIFSSLAIGEDINTQKDAANKLVTLGILTGYTDGTLKLDNTITRAEFTTVAVRLICKDNLMDKYKIDTKFNDVSSKHWASPYINIAVEEGLVNGYPDDTFKPENNITYGEVLTLLVRILGYKDSVSDKDEWPVNYVKKAIELEINQNLVIPVNSNATRGDVAVFVNNSLLVELNKKY